MRYEVWNKIIKEYFFSEGNDNEVFINIDKDTLIEYVIRTGVMRDSIKQIQEAQRERNGEVQPEETLIWQDFLGVVRPANVSKEYFFNRMKRNISYSDSDGLYMLFPYFALFSMPLSNNPELNARNFYTRLSNFLVEERLIAYGDVVGTGDFASIDNPSLREIWIRLENWANDNGFNYHLKYQFQSNRNNYVAPFMAECLFTASRKEKLRNIFYRAGLAPGNDLTDTEIVGILDRYHNEFDFDNAKWRTARDRYLSLIISTFRKEYQLWDGNAIVVNRNGRIRNNEYAGTRQSLLLRANRYRGHYYFSLLAFMPDASFAESFEYESREHGLSYEFVVNQQKYAEEGVWSDRLCQCIRNKQMISFNRRGFNGIELIYRPNNCELLEFNSSEYISCRKLIAGKEYLMLIDELNDNILEWLNQNSAIEIANHDLYPQYHLYRIRCVETELEGTEISKLEFAKTSYAKPVCNLSLGNIDNSKAFYKGFKTFFEIEGLSVVEDKPKAVFNSEGRIEEKFLMYNNRSNLWFLPKITNYFTLQKSFQIYCNNQRMSSDSYRLCDFNEPNYEDLEEIQFNEFGELDPKGKFMGLSLDNSQLNDVNFGSLLENMRREGYSMPKSSGDYTNSDYLLYYLSCRGKCKKDDIDVILQSLSLNKAAAFSRENRWAILDLLSNYFRMGYINYVYYNGEHIIKANKPTFVLLPPRISKTKPQHLNTWTYKQLDSYWTVLLTGARTPALVAKLITRAQNNPNLSYRISPVSSNLLPQSVFVMANELSYIEELARELNISFTKCIYANTLLRQIATVDAYRIHIMQTESSDRYDGIQNYEVVDYMGLANTGIYRKTGALDENSSIVTYFPGSFRTQTIYWKNGHQYKVDKYWGHLIGMNDKGARVFNINEEKSCIDMPVGLQLPLLYARALTLISGEIPSIQDGVRSYAICENPYTLAVDKNSILNQLGQ